METIYPVNLHEYMRLFRDRKIYRANQTPLIEHIGLYIYDGKVLNKSKKVGLNSWFTIITDRLPQHSIINAPNIKID